METVSNICAVIVGISIFVIPVLFVVWLIRKIMKKPTKKIGKATIIVFACAVVFTMVGSFADPATYCDHEYELVESEDATCEKGGYEKYHCDLCGRDKTEKLKKLGHDMVEVRRVEPTYDADGEYVKRCNRCGYEEIEVLEKLVKATKPTETENPVETQEPTEDSHEVSDGAQMVLSMIAEDMAKQVAQNPGTVKMSIFSQGFYKDGHTYAVQSDFTCSNLMGVKESHTIKVIAVSNEDESKISPTEVYLDGELIWVREE